jgi:hypothetical protein
MLCLCPIAANAKPKIKVYKNGPQDVFQAAMRTARERHVVTYVDEKNLMFTFQTGTSMLSYGFIANASVEQQPDGTSKLIINVQHKNDGKNASFSFNAGDRMADKFFEQVEEELARNPTQTVADKPEAAHIEAPPQAQPTSLKEQPQTGAVTVVSTPDGAEVSVDGNFVGNAPSTLKLAPGKHSFGVVLGGFKPWSRDLTVVSGSEVKLNAALEK